MSYVNSHGNWLFFDDEDVQLQDEAQVQTAYGSSQVRALSAGIIVRFKKRAASLGF